MLAIVASGSTGGVRAFAVTGVVVAVVFVLYVVAVDVPMYLRRYRHGRARGRTYLGLSQGLRDVWERREPDHRWSSWRQDAAWLTPYFSVGAWLSLLLVFAPPP